MRATVAAALVLAALEGVPAAATTGPPGPLQSGLRSTGASSIHLLPAGAHSGLHGFVRIINHSARDGTVAIHPVDDDGRTFEAVILSIGANEAAHFNSGDLEMGNPGKGLSGHTGPGQGDWRLTFDTDLDVEALSYVRAADGFVTSMDGVAPEADGVRRMAFFNPGSNWRQQSRLRLVNAGTEAAAVRIQGRDDAGNPSSGEVTAVVPAGASRTFTAAELESGNASGLSGALGDGDGKWRLEVRSDGQVAAMSLLASPTGHLANLSAAPARLEAGATHSVPLFLPGSNPQRQSFLRVANRSLAAEGTVRIEALDRTGSAQGPVTLSLAPGQARHFNSTDLEMGNASKGLTGGIGPSRDGDWRLELSSDLDIDVLAYVRTADGFVTSMDALAPTADGLRHRVAFFNPASNHRQRSLLRLVNRGPAAEVTIAGLDDRGMTGEREVVVRVPRRGSTTIDARMLESGGAGLAGRLGDGDGKWRLTVSADRPVAVMSLLQSPTGHLTNLSARKDGGNARGGTSGAACPDGGTATGAFGFPDGNAEVKMALDDAPLTAWTAAGGTGTGAVTYSSDDVRVATVHPECGSVTPVGIGSATITAVRADGEGGIAESASYVLTVYEAKGEVVSRETVDAGDGGRAVETRTVYASGMEESVTEHIGAPDQFGSPCNRHRSTDAKVLLRIVARLRDGVPLSHLVTCAATGKIYPDIPPLAPSELDRRLSGAMRFTPKYVEDHGAVVSTVEEAYNIGTATTTEYASGFRELAVSERFHEYQQGLDYNADGDTNDFVSIAEVFWDNYLHSRQVKVFTSRDGALLEDSGKLVANAPRRIAMPAEGIPHFLRFHGPIDDLVVRIAAAGTDGHYHVQIDGGDPAARWIVTKDFQGVRPDHFTRAPLIEDAADAVYRIHVVDGPLYLNVLDEYPNFWVRHDYANFLIPSLLKGALDRNRHIVRRSNLPEFLAYYDAIRVEYDPRRQSSGYFNNTAALAPSQVYVDRPLIHEVCHGYHDRVLPDGFDNAEVKALYAMVPSDLDQRFGDERNNYWRTDHAEFFAESLTTYIYLESGLAFDDFDPLSQVDSTFYLTEMKPYFDRLFGR